MHIKSLHQIAALADDLDASIAFYRDILRVTFLAKYDPPGLAFFDLGGVRLLLEKGATRATLYFWVEDIDAAYNDLLSKGVVFDREPHLVHKDDSGEFGVPGGEEWMAFFSDPAGNTLALATRRLP
jgi:methylmalonyl-CoA/ethylmalonyl-CoA epimerase